MRLCIAKVAFPPANEPCAPGAADVIPPWVALTHSQSALPHLFSRLSTDVLADVVAMAFVQPRGADAPALRFDHMRLCIAKVAFPPANERCAPGAADVIPPWVPGPHLWWRYRTRSVTDFARLEERRASARHGSGDAHIGRMRVCAVNELRQERRASIRRAFRERICGGDTAHVRQTARD